MATAGILTTRPAPRWRMVLARLERWGWIAVAALVAFVATLVLLRGFLLIGTLALAALVGATWFARKWPALMFVGFLWLACFAGSVNAYMPSVPIHRMADLVILGLLGSAVLQYVSERRDRAARVWPGAVMLAAWVVYSFVSIAYSESLDLGFEAWRTQMLFPVIFLSLGYTQWPPGTRERILKGVVGVAFLVGFYAVFRKITGASSAELGRLSDYDTVNHATATVGGFENRQEIAGWVAVTIPLCLALAMSFTGRWRYIAALAAGMCTVAMFASQTRIAVPALALGLLIAGSLMLASRASAGRRPLMLAAIIIAMLVGIGGYTTIIGGSPADAARYSRIFTPKQDASGFAHIEKWKVTIEQMKGHPWGLGVGAAGTKSQELGRFVNADTYDIDNSYLQIAFQQGWIVMGFFVLAVLAIFYGLAKGALVLRDRTDSVVAVAACAGLAAWLVAMMSGAFLERWCTFTVFAIAGLGAAPLLTGRSEPDAQQS
jgi:O-antigen ligase